ncbi:MAG: SH3 domain-containing protein [Thermomicrobiales bacterium]
MGFDGWARPVRFRMLAAGMLVLLIAGCGSTGGDKNSDQTPTATIWPTVNDAVEATSPEASPPWQMIEPTEQASTPNAPTATDVAATPAATPSVGTASSPTSAVAVTTVPAPTATETLAASTPRAVTSAPSIATPQPATTAVPTAASSADVTSGPVVQEANPETGDGTSGPPAIADLPPRTPAASTPVASPAASPAAGARVLVTSCSPADVPPFTGATSSFITTSDVNIRIGPGTDCDPAADPLAQGTLLTVTSGEVVRDGQDGTTWVRVEVDGLEGWVSTEYITPDNE